MDAFAAFAIAYLLGSIPFGLLLTRLCGTQDLRSVGSGNIGATNVLRTGRKGLAAATLLLDAGKGALAVALAGWWSDKHPIVFGAAALGALVGHCFPVWLRFRGGKGVATMLGVSFALDWRIGAAAALGWLVAFTLTRVSSLGGLASAAAAPIAAYTVLRTTEDWGVAVAMVVNTGTLLAIAAVVFWQHRGNIVRLFAGTEGKVGQSK